LLAGDDLTIVLFFVGTAVSLGCAAMSTAGWRHPALIMILFGLAAICFVFGAAWPAIKDISPTALSEPVHQIATSPVAWFAVLILGMTASILMPRRRSRQERATPQLRVAEHSVPSIVLAKVDKKLEPLPTPQEPVFIDVKPNDLIHIFRTMTSIQAKALTAKHIGKWISHTSQVTNVSGDLDWLAVQLYEGTGGIVSAICSRPASERAIHFTQGITVTVQGQIEDIDGISVRLKHCDFS
jgi:hypothetical protein